MPPTILLATANPHKVEELRAIFAAANLPITFLSLADLPHPTTEPTESGATFEQNATIKALSYAAQSGLPALADDSGLEVDALHGRPGVISSHYSTDGHETGLSRPDRDRLNNARLLRELQNIPPENRSARFVCVMALAAAPNHSIHRPHPLLTRATLEGQIGIPPHVPRGLHGFGYDPLFLLAPHFTHTTAEVPPHQKNQISHRAKAAAQMAVLLANLP